MELDNVIRDLDDAEPCIVELFAAARAEPLRVVDLTDEEIAGLDGPDADHVAPMPWYRLRSVDDQELAATVALRGMLSRGLLRLSGDHSPDGEAVLDLPPDVLAALALRHEARAIVIADQQVESGVETRVLYQHPEGVLTEAVNAGGVHRFTVSTTDLALADLVDWCAGADDIGGDATLERLAEASLPADALPATLTDLAAVVTLDAVGPPPGDAGDGPPQARALTLYRLTDGRVAVVERAPAASDGTDLVVGALSLETLSARIVAACVFP